MSFPVFYFVGGEDLDYVPSSGNASVTTTSGSFDALLARCALKVGATSVPTSDYWRQGKPFSTSFFWHSFWLNPNTGVPGVIAAGYPLVRYWDASHVVRLQIRSSVASGSFNAMSFVVEKVNAAGAATQLGSSFSIPISGGALGKLDINVNCAVAGSITIYSGGSNLLFSFIGDTTTNGVTLLAGHDLMMPIAETFSASSWMYYSQIMVSDSDTRSMLLQSLPPVANGNTHNFDVGSPAASNVNEITISDATLDGASAAGLIDQYTTAALASGSFAIAAIAVSARLMRGFGGPSRMDIGVRSGGADYWGPDEVLNASFTSGYQEIWNTDPATAASWTALPTNIGLKAVA